MSKNAMAGAVTLCGVGLCMIAGAMMMQSGNHANAAGAMNAPAVATSVAAAAAAQSGPTIVWYGTYGGMYGSNLGGVVLRAWSDGTVEMKKISYFSGSPTEACNSPTPCSSPWLVLSSPTQGFRAASDSNADEQVDGVDLSTLLANWGVAPRVDFPPSDCPLNLVNP